MTEPTVFRGRLPGKVAIVTGAGSQGEGDGVGTGKAIALLFAGEGARICLVDRDEARARDTLERIEAAGGEAFVVAADVTRDADCKAAVDQTLARYGRVDILVNNVGIATPKHDFATFDEAVWDKVLATNLKSALLMCRHAVPAMVTGGGGAVVNISSVAAVVAHASFDYGPSKAAMEQLAREISVIYGRRGIRANTVAPGHIYTPMVSGRMAPATRELRRKLGSLGIEGDAWDIAQAALFLASDEARFITGQHLVVDGGVTSTSPMYSHNRVMNPEH